MEHKALLINHRLESWVYADAADRTGATGFASGDVGRIAYQSDTGEYWRLTATTPTWALIAPYTPPAAPSYASLQTSPGGPSPTTVAAGVMMGLGVAGAKITPAVTGKIFVVINGRTTSNATNAGSIITLAWGSPGSAAPANGAAPIGTSIGSIIGRTGTGWVAAMDVPFSISYLLTGLPLGTQIWFDAILAATGGGSAFITNVTVSAVELP